MQGPHASPMMKQITFTLTFHSSKKRLLISDNLGCVDDDPNERGDVKLMNILQEFHQSKTCKQLLGN
jgi:hypothetical protein